MSASLPHVRPPDIVLLSWLRMRESGEGCGSLQPVCAWLRMPEAGVAGADACLV